MLLLNDKMMEDMKCWGLKIQKPNKKTPLGLKTYESG